MSVVGPNKTSWTAIAVGRAQVFNGRVLYSTSNTPAENDYHIWQAGTVVDIHADGYVRALDDDAYVVVL